jgi:DNA repair protein RecO (recombination protein O)
MKTDLHHCYVLHTRPYRETSLLVDILSSRYGRVRVTAKGVKRPKNNKSVLLQPGVRLLLAWSLRGTLGTLMSLEDSGTRFILKGTKIISCFYLNELLIRLLHSDEPHEEIFKIYHKSLEALARGEEEQKVLRIFEKKLLQELGYGLILDHDVNTGETIDESKIYFYVIDNGPSLYRSKAGESIQISGKALLALKREEQWEPEIAGETKKLLRMVLKSHTGERPMGSRELYRAYLQNAKGA